MLYFLKLGGSLITHKNKKRTCRKLILKQIATEIAQAYSNMNFSLLIGHGSGSFGHIPAKQFNTRQGVRTLEEWRGFVEVWKEARKLNQIVVETFQEAGLPIMAFPPSAVVIPENGNIIDWDISAIKMALSKNIIPLIQGDVVFDRSLGGTILSTEELFLYLAKYLKPNRIFLTGIEEGVWLDYPFRSQLLKTISSITVKDFSKFIYRSEHTDVTGGMLEKVKSMIDLINFDPDLKIYIFSGVHKNKLLTALCGQDPGGTAITK
jgi:isopentenyl phosphate kinase